MKEHRDRNTLMVILQRCHVIRKRLSYILYLYFDHMFVLSLLFHLVLACFTVGFISFSLVFISWTH